MCSANRDKLRPCTGALRRVFPTGISATDLHARVLLQFRPLDGWVLIGTPGERPRKWYRVLLINTLEASLARLGRQSVQGLQKRCAFSGAKAPVARSSAGENGGAARNGTRYARPAVRRYDQTMLYWIVHWLLSGVALLIVAKIARYSGRRV
jgi:hypothetical protein